MPAYRSGFQRLPSILSKIRLNRRQYELLHRTQECQGSAPVTNARPSEAAARTLSLMLRSSPAFSRDMAMAPPPAPHCSSSNPRLCCHGGWQSPTTITSARRDKDTRRPLGQDARETNPPPPVEDIGDRGPSITRGYSGPSELQPTQLPTHGMRVSVSPLVTETVVWARIWRILAEMATPRFSSFTSSRPDFRGLTRLLFRFEPVVMRSGTSRAQGSGGALARCDLGQGRPTGLCL